MKSSKILLSISILFSINLLSCGASTGSRYAQEEEHLKKTNNDSAQYTENFDLSRYHAKINIPEKNKPADSASANIWYSYHENPDFSDTAKAAVKTLPGYRVLVLSTDNLDDANNMRSEIYFKSDHTSVYVIFDPPFYKVEAGDFTDINDAKGLSFKLKQMGYNDVRVINETINKFR
jgi:hypothetical protein